MVFSERTAVLDLLSLILTQAGVKSVFYDGRRNTKERDMNLDIFKRSQPGK